MALGTAGQSPVGDHETTAAETAELARAAAEYESFAPDASPAAGAAALPAAGQAPGPDALPAALPAAGQAALPAALPPDPGGRPAAALLPALPTGGTDPKAPPVEDVIVTTRTGYHVLRFVETTFDSSVFLHLWLDRSTGNLALARLRLRELAERLVLV
nr:hypothetical protein [Streptomyces sp. CB03234]